MDLYWQWGKTNLSMIHGFTTVATSQTTCALLPRSSYPDSLDHGLPRVCTQCSICLKVLLSFSHILSSCSMLFSSQLSLLSSKVFFLPLWLPVSWYILLEYLYLCHTVVHIWEFFRSAVWLAIYLSSPPGHTQTVLSYRACVQLVHHYTQHPASSVVPEDLHKPLLNDWMINPPSSLNTLCHYVLHTYALSAALLPSFRSAAISPRKLSVVAMVHRYRVMLWKWCHTHLMG